MAFASVVKHEGIFPVRIQMFKACRREMSNVFVPHWIAFRPELPNRCCHIHRVPGDDSIGEQMMKQTQRFLTAEWRDLAMVNFEIDPQLLRHRGPRGTELDTWNGRTFISIVGFRFLRTQVLGLTIPWHRNFEEVNLRFYVRRLSPEGKRRGVVFIKELVPRVAIAWVARCMYNENYIALPMRHETTLPLPDQSGPGSVAYEWQVSSRWNRLVLSVQGTASVPVEDSEEALVVF
jgi:Uncharacterized conserved protein (COG2071)